MSLNYDQISALVVEARYAIGGSPQHENRDADCHNVSYWLVERLGGQIFPVSVGDHMAVALHATRQVIDATAGQFCAQFCPGAPNANIENLPPELFECVRSGIFPVESHYAFAELIRGAQ